MIGLITSISFSCVLLYISYIKRKNFSDLVRYHLALLPQTPIILFLHHNLDTLSFKEPAWPLMLPVFTSLVILTVQSTQFLIDEYLKGKKFTLSPIMIGYVAYCFFCIGSALLGANPSWSLYAIFWTLPFGFLFFLGGGLFNSEAKGTPLSYSVIFSCLLSFIIVIFALVTGRADSLFNTRSFGSILSTTGILQMLILYVPLASFEKRNRIINIIFWIAPVILFALSLSRSAVLPMIVYLFSLIVTYKKSFKKMFFQPYFYFIGTFVSVSCLALILMTKSGEVWISRFVYLPFAIQTRLEKFGPYIESAQIGNPFAGVGYGLTRFFHPNGFTDLHNLLLTELYENGLGAALSFALILCFVFFYIFKSINNNKVQIMAFATLFVIVLAHLQGCNLAIRNPNAYNTPYFLCILFYVFGLLEKEVLGQKNSRSV